MTMLRLSNLAYRRAHAGQPGTRPARAMPATDRSLVAPFDGEPSDTPARGGVRSADIRRGHDVHKRPGSCTNVPAEAL
jgi:hypothetical protein